MIFGLLLLPVAILLLLLAGLSVQALITELWAEGALQAWLLLVFLPLALWIACSAIRGWWDTRKGAAKQVLPPASS